MAKGSGGAGGSRGVGGAGGRSASGTGPAALVASIGGIGKASSWDQGMRSMALHNAGYAGATKAQATAIATGKRDVMNVQQMSSSRRFKPVRVDFEVHRDGRVTSNVVDGRHRIAAAKSAGASKILARVRVHREQANGDWKESADKTGVFKL